MESLGKTCSSSGSREAWPGLCLTCETQLHVSHPPGSHNRQHLSLTFWPWLMGTPHSWSPITRAVPQAVWVLLHIELGSPLAF